MYIGELISIAVAIMWAITAVCFEYAGKRVGAIPINFIRMFLCLLLGALLLLVLTGKPFPIEASKEAWFWLSVSGFIGFVLGDFCLFYAYVILGSRFGQLFMTLAPIAAAITGRIILREKMGALAWLGMLVTITGIAISILNKNKKIDDLDQVKVKKNFNFGFSVKLPRKGVLFGIGAGLGQGIGLVFSKYGMNIYTEDLIKAGKEVTYLVPFAASEMRTVIAVISFLIIVLVTHNVQGVKNCTKDWKSSVAVFVGATIGPFLGVALSLMAVQYTESGIAQTIMSTSPILLIIPAFFIFKQQVKFVEIVGAVISVLGASLFFIV